MKNHYKRIILACLTLVTTSAWSQSRANRGFESLNNFAKDWKNTPAGPNESVNSNMNSPFKQEVV